jgi:hypothetical protein
VTEHDLQAGIGGGTAPSGAVGLGGGVVRTEVLGQVGVITLADERRRNALMWLARYSRAIAAALLALIAFGSLLFTPFTEQYARDSVPRQFWGSATFKATNRRLTTMWACVFAAMVPFHVAAGVIDKKPTNILFNWVIPIGLIVWGAKRSDEIASSAKSPG